MSIAYEQFSFESSEDMEPPSLTYDNPYLRRVTGLHNQLQTTNLRSTNWVSDDGETRLSFWNRRQLDGRIGGLAFRGYINKVGWPGKVLEQIIGTTMDELASYQTGELYSHRAVMMQNHSALLFEPSHHAYVLLEQDADKYPGYLAMRTEGITSSSDRQVLLGGLATTIYALEHPDWINSLVL